MNAGMSSHDPFHKFSQCFFLGCEPLRLTPTVWIILIGFVMVWLDQLVFEIIIIFFGIRMPMI